MPFSTTTCIKENVIQNRFKFRILLSGKFVRENVATKSALPKTSGSAKLTQLKIIEKHKFSRKC